MKIKSQTFTQASGSIAGFTASRNRGGMYLRARSMVHNQSTAAQVVVRNAVSALVTAWQTTLTGAQRTAWTTYAQNSPVLDALGNSIVLTGLNMYIRGNVPRIQAGIARVDAGPTSAGFPHLSTPSFTIVGSTGVATVAYTNTDPWAILTGGALLVWLSRPANVSIVYFKGPFQYAGDVLGNTMTPPTSPASITAVSKGATGNKYFAKISSIDAQGRLSSSQIVSATAT